MKNYTLFIVILLLLFWSTNWIQAQNENQIAIGNTDSLYSEILGEQRNLWIHVPESSNSKEKFPVVYLLDGRSHFHAVVGMLNFMVGVELCPEMIVVAIPNTDRFRDLTTSHVGDQTNTSGGAEEFIQFMEKELIPFVDKKYPAAPYRTIMGHSLGGLVVVNTLIKHSAIFNNYLAIDPSLSWDNQKLLNEASSILEKKTFENKSLYIAIANTIGEEMDFATAQKILRLQLFI